MKKISYFLLTALLLMGMPACNLLDQTSPNNIDADLVFTDASSVENALLGIYSSMQSRNYYGGNYALLADAIADDITTGGYDLFSLDELDDINPTSGNILISATYTDIYRTIANVNYLLDGMKTVASLDPDRAKIIEGEARTIRAMAHFDLLRYFGYHWDVTSANGIPIVNRKITFEDIVPRASVADCYTFIINELEAALALVDAEARDAAYINSSSVNALLARVNLYKGDKNKAVTYATAVINDAAYSLLPVGDLAKIYSERHSSESIFELAFDTRNRSAFNSLTYGRPDAERPELFFMADVALGDFFANRPDDARATLVNFNPDENPGMTPDGRTQKYRGEETKDNPAYILRLAEMYLIRAECADATQALIDINTLREARGMTPLAATDIDTPEKWVTVILDERRAELNFEGHRYFDLARTGRFVSDLGIDPADAYKAALPIPIKEINATGIAQNPGY